MYKQKLYDSMVQVLTCEFAVVGMMGCDSEALLQAFHRVEMIFDNHHPDGITRNQWLANLLFYNKLYNGQQFQITEETF